jgi:hypothetical protein
MMIHDASLWPVILVERVPFAYQPCTQLHTYITRTFTDSTVYSINKTKPIIPPKITKREAKSSNKALLLLATAFIIAIISVFQRPAISSFAKQISSRFSSTTAQPIKSMSTLQFKFRPSETRGNADHGWLKVSTRSQVFVQY